jgi:hypothetical protein
MGSANLIFIPPGVEHSYLTTHAPGAQAVFAIARSVA